MAQPQRGRDMLDREIEFTGECPENSAPKPATGEARVERQCTVVQPYHSTDVLAEIRQHECGIGKDARVVLCHLERLPGKIAGLATVRLRLFGPAVIAEPVMTVRRPRQCRPVMRIDRDRLNEQSQSLEHPLFRYRVE